MAEKLPSGKYRTRATYTDEQGKRRSVSFTRNSAKEADYAALEFKLGKRRTAASAAMPLRDAAERFLESNDAVLSPSTVAVYTRYLNNYLAPISAYRVDKLTTQNVQAWINGLARKHSPKTVRNAYGFLCSVVKAVGGSAFDVNLPQRKVQEIIIPQREDIEAMLAAAEGKRIYLPILLAAHCGLRRSEICALTWDDVDMKKRKIHIRHAVVENGHGYSTKKPKSMAGTRDVDMTDRIYEHLLTKPDPLIGYTPSSLSCQFRRFCEANSFDCHLHLLRHYFASVLAAQGIPIKYAMMLMGHNSADMINKVYAHILNEEEQKARYSVAKYFNGY